MRILTGCNSICIIREVCMPMEEFEALGRTKLRVELKLRGLSPSGLKEELMHRLAQHLASPAAAAYGLTPLVNKLR